MLDHRAHDYFFLLRRWRAVAREAGLRLQRLENSTELPTFYVRSKALRGGTEGIYISAGIHGDEPASSEALILWAENNVHRLADLPLLLLPCLNPWGLLNNSRHDSNGVDLNRTFHRDDLPVVSAVKTLAAPFQFNLALTLHEDFDAQGLYLYELHSKRVFWGETLIDVARPIIPIESRAKVDGRRARLGLIRPRFQQRIFDKMGYPEAIWFYMNNARRSVTLETPSEFALDQRVKAQVAVINACVEKALE